MEKSIENIMLLFSGGVKEITNLSSRCSLVAVEDPLFRVDVSTDFIWEDDEIKKLSQAMWERASVLIRKKWS